MNLALKVISFSRKLIFILLVIAPLFRVTARPVKIDEAITMTTGWLSESRKRLDHTLSVNITSAKAFTGETGQVIYYVVSLDPHGFIITAADDGIEPVIAFSATGVFEPDPANPLSVLLASDMSQRTAEAQIVGDAITDDTSVGTLLSAGIAAAEEHRNRWRDLLKRADGGSEISKDSVTGVSSVSDMRVAPLVESRWNQKTAQGLACYNYYCPPGPDGNANNYYCGCVATAMGQLMRYWQWPTGAYSHVYNYADMPLNPQTVSPLTVTHRQAVGRLLRDAGTSVSMSYGSGGSSANMLIVDTALTNVFGYSNARDIYRSSGIDSTTRNLVLRSNLASHLPVLMGIRRSGGGHAVVCDGFGYSSGTLYYHVNMGWGGSSDAWYNLPTVDAYYTYTSVDAFVYNIYTNGSGEIIAGRVLSSSGTAVSGAVVTATGGYVANTDAKGYYGVRVPSSATYSLTAVAAGYQNQTINGISVGTSSTSSSGNCGNYFGADFSLAPFTFRAVALTNSVVLRWIDPFEFGMSNQNVHIRYDTSDYPATTNAGSFAYEGTNQMYEHTGLTSGQPYYYTIFVSHDGTNFIEPE